MNAAGDEPGVDGTVERLARLYVAVNKAGQRKRRCYAENRDAMRERAAELAEEAREDRAEQRQQRNGEQREFIFDHGCYWCKRWNSSIGKTFWPKMAVKVCGRQCFRYYFNEYL